MKKIITMVLIGALASSQVSVKANIRNDNAIDENQGNRTVESIDITGIQEVWFFEGDDGDIYMQEGLEIKKAIEVNETEIKSIDLELTRAPSIFILQGSRNLIGITITADVIKAGTTAVKTAIKTLIIAKASGVISLKIAAVTAIADFADVIVSTTKFGSYKSNIIHKYYGYNGCDWLGYDEFELPTGDEIGEYSWSDNPVLGIAPYVCKIASQTYPY